MGKESCSLMLHHIYKILHALLVIFVHIHMKLVMVVMYQSFVPGSTCDFLPNLPIVHGHSKIIFQRNLLKISPYLWTDAGQTGNNALITGASYQNEKKETR